MDRLPNIDFVVDDRFYLKNDEAILQKDNGVLYIFSHPHFVAKAFIFYKICMDKYNVGYVITKEVQGINLKYKDGTTKCLIPEDIPIDTVIKDYNNIIDQINANEFHLKLSSKDYNKIVENIVKSENITNE